MNRGLINRACLLMTVMVATFSGAAFGQERTVLFDTGAAGETKSIPTWGLDTQWLYGWNVDRGVRYMGQPQVDVIRFAFTGNTPIVDGNLTGSGVTEFNDRMSIVTNFCDSHTKLYLGNDTDVDTDSLDSSYDNGDGVKADKWAELINVTRSNCVASGRTVIAVEPFNEPDYSTWQGGAYPAGATRLDAVCDQLRTTYSNEFSGIDLCGGTTLNDDVATAWYDTVNGSTGLEGGCTHQLAGSFDSYAAFFQHVVSNGDVGVNDELHNVMEAMVGAQYGMSVGIWWGTAERARGEFVKASDGKRLAYAEDRPSWTAASVYRPPSATKKVQAFVGESERQSLPKTYRFFSKDRPVFYDGQGPQRAYEVTTTGDSTYQSSNHHNAERVVNITWGDDVQPAIDGRYYVVNRKSGKLMEIASASTNNGVNIQQYTYSPGDLTQQWDINPRPNTSGGDYSFYSVNNVYGGGAADVDGLWASANVKQWTDGAPENGQWFLEYAGNGWFYIRNRLSGLYLEVSSGSTSDGANIGQYTLYTPDPTHQQWKLVPVGADPTDTTAPAKPTGLVATANAVSVQLDWNANSESDLAGYNILRYKSGSGTGFELIARNVVTNQYTDSPVNQSGVYYYRVVAVDQSGNKSSFPTVLATPTLNPVLVAQYGFEGNSKDASINGNDSSLHGVAGYGSGILGSGSLVLNGGSGYAELPAEVVNYDQVTIAAWVYWSGGDNWQRLFDFGNLTDEYLILSPSDGGGQLRFGITTNGYPNEETLLADALPVGQWTHVAVTLSNTTATLYVNGTNVASSASFSIKPSDFNPVLNYIGRSQFDTDPLFDGKIDDFRIYNYALSATDVADLANVPLPTQSTTVGYWNFEEGSADENVPAVDIAGAYSGTILDVSGAGNHASPYWSDLHVYRADTPLSATPQNGMANHLSVQNGTSTPSISTTGTGLSSWNPTAWTIEATYKWDGTGGWFKTIVGRDGRDVNTTQAAAAPLYLSIRGDDLAVSFTDNMGLDHTIESVPGIVIANHWQTVAAISDGSTLSLYMKDITAGDSGYTWLGQLDISGSANPALAIGNGDGSDWNAGDFSFGRGLYNGGHTDRFYGYIDDIRFSNTALDTSELLYSTPAVPGAPADLAAESGDSQVSLSWNAVPNATSYTVKCALTNVGPYTAVNTPATTNYVHTGLTNGTRYYYVVSATGVGGESTNSQPVVSAIPSAAVSAAEFFIANPAIEGGTNLSLTVPNSVLGHDYGILATESLTPPVWSNILVQAGSGSNLMFGIPVSGTATNRFFKLDVQRQ